MEKNEIITEQKERNHFIQFIREYTGSQLFKIAIMLFVVGACFNVMSQIILSFELATNVVDLGIFLIADVFLVGVIAFPTICLLLVYKDSKSEDLNGGRTLTVLKIAQVCLIILAVILGLIFLLGLLIAVVLIVIDYPSRTGALIGIAILVGLLFALPILVLSFLPSFKVLGGLKRNIVNNEFKPIPMGTFFVVYNFIILGFSFLSILLFYTIMSLTISVLIFVFTLFSFLFSYSANTLFLVVFSKINKAVKEYANSYN